MTQKFWTKSLTIVASILGILVQAAPILGINFTADDAALLNEFADKLVSLIMFGLAIFGRWRATTTITMSRNPQ